VYCSFDQALLNVQNIDNQREDWKVFITEMEAQFFFHCGTALLNKALKVRCQNCWSYFFVGFDVL
jgi:hypothetical protein